jgi:hypothetical protein
MGFAMTHRKTQFSLTVALCLGSMLTLADAIGPRTFAQAPAAAPAAARQLGTVKSISADTITLATDAGQAATITLSANTKVLKLAAGSTDLKTAQPGQVSDITVGDRVLATGNAGESPMALTAARVILMKSSDIADKNAAEQAQWRTNGVAGVVSAVDPNGGAISLTAGANKFTVTTSGQTVFKRFSGDSVNYQDAKQGTLADIHAGDQLQARGQKSADGLSVKAEEVLSGSFKNLSGLIITADPTAITLKDLATKKVMTVNVTPNTNIRRLPPQMAQMFATRAQGGRAAGGDQSGAARGAPGGARGNSGGQGGEAGGPGGGRRGGELSQMLSRFPTETVTGLKKGDAVMVVASEPAPGASTVTAITLLTGVEPILTANPNGGMDLSGWSMGAAPGGSAEQ